MNRLGLKGEPAPQPQHTLFSPTSLLLWGYAGYCCCLPTSPVLLHIYTALIPYLAAYILPSFPVLLRFIYTTPSSPVLLHIYCTCFSTYFLTLSSLHPFTFNENVFTLVSLIFCCILACKYNAVYTCEPTPFCLDEVSKRND